MEKTIEIQNLKCGGCQATILRSLGLETGVHNVSVDVENSTVYLEYDTQTALDKVQNTLTKLGYPMVGKQNSLGRKAKSYVSCAVGRMVK